MKIITMDYRDRYERRMHRRMERRRNCNRNSGPVVGLLFLVSGGVLISRAVGVPIPDYIISWQMLLITIGAIIGFASRFRHPGFIFPIIIGTFFLLQEFFPGIIPKEFILPTIFILLGIFLIFKPRRWRRDWHQDGPNDGDSGPGGDNPDNITTPPTNEEKIVVTPGFQNQGPTGFYHQGSATTDQADRLEETTVFGNIRKTLITKNFIGGEVSTVFGSAEINLLQADMQQNCKLEINAVFGSVRLIVPTHWQVKLKTAAVLGAVEDKRPKHAIYSDRLLVLEGNAVFGGIQIESH